MFKKLSLIAASLAVLVAAVPAVAGASTGLTEGGVLIKTPAIITGTSTNAVVKNTKFGTLTCAKVTLEGELTVNSASAGVKAVGTSNPGFGTTCEVGGQTATVEQIKLTSIESGPTEKLKGKASFSFVAVLPGSLKCTFTGSSIPGTYVADSDVLTIVPESALSVTPASCVSKTPTISGSFTLETKDKTPVTIME